MVAIISTASQAQANNGANPIVRHQAHKSRGQSEASVVKAGTRTSLVVSSQR